MKKAKINLEETIKESKLFGFFELIIFILVATLVEIGVGYSAMTVATKIIESANIDLYGSAYYWIMITVLTIIGLIFSILNYGIVLPKITNRINLKAKAVICVLVFSFIIIGAIQFISVSCNGFGVFGLLANSVNTYSLIYFSTSNGFENGIKDFIVFILLFGFGCMLKPICYAIGNKLKQ